MNTTPTSLTQIAYQINTGPELLLAAAMRYPQTFPKPIGSNEGIGLYDPRQVTAWWESYVARL